LVKPVEQAELLVCIHSLARRLKTEKHEEEPDLILDVQALSLSGPAGSVPLTYPESLLLVAMNRAVGQKLERWQAMQLIDSKEKGLLPANLEMRISALRKKMEACGGSAESIRTLRGFGYSLSCRVRVI
jgi:DNA-binding response OmpR family regulator